MSELFLSILSSFAMFLLLCRWLLIWSIAFLEFFSIKSFCFCTTSSLVLLSQSTIKCFPSFLQTAGKRIVCFVICWLLYWIVWSTTSEWLSPFYTVGILLKYVVFFLDMIMIWSMQIGYCWLLHSLCFLEALFSRCQNGAQPIIMHWWMEVNNMEVYIVLSK